MKYLIDKNKDISYINITNSNNFKVILSTLGAALYAVEYKEELMTLTPTKEIFDKSYLYHGKTIGRVANRLKGNEIIINGNKYLIADNEGGNTLHGGKEGLSTKIFDYEIKEEKDYLDVIFHYLSNDNESGFPGNLDVTISYRIYEKETKIDLSLEATTDKETLCSLTNHAYFTLANKDFNELSLQIKGGNYILPDNKTLLGLKREKVPSYLDFTKLKNINEDINNPILVNSRTNGYDHHFFFNEIEYKNPQITLENNKYRLEILTDYSGVQIYTDNYKDTIPYLNENRTIRRGIAIEPEESHLELHYLKPQEKYIHHIRYIFSSK